MAHPRLTSNRSLTAAALLGVILFAAGPARAETLTFERVLLEMPELSTYIRDVPLADVVWTGEYFVVTSHACNFRTQRGLWVFSAAGRLVGRRDVCIDGFLPGEALGTAGHMWGVSSTVVPISGSRFVHLGQGASGFAYPLTVYEVQAGRVEINAQTWRLSGDLNTVPSDGIYPPSGPEIPRFRSATLLPEGLWAQHERREGGTRVYTQVLLSPDTLEVLQERDGGSERIAGGVDGNLFGATPDGDDITHYTFSPDGLAIVGRLPGEVRGTFRLDPFSPARFGFIKSTQARAYFGSSDSIFEAEAPIPLRNSRAGVAFYGDYTAIGECESAGAGRGTGCAIRLLRSGEEVARVDVPSFVDRDGNEFQGSTDTLAISADGTLVSVAENGAMLFRIGGFSPSAVGAPPAPPPTDASLPDASPRDASLRDASATDAGSRDSGSSDASMVTDGARTRIPSTDPGGCSAQPQSSPGPSFWFALLSWLLIRRRKNGDRCVGVLPRENRRLVCDANVVVSKGHSDKDRS